MVWTSLVLSIGLLVVACVYSGYKYKEITDTTGNKSDFKDLINVGFTSNFDSYLQLSSNYKIISNQSIIFRAFFVEMK